MELLYNFRLFFEKLFLREVSGFLTDVIIGLFSGSLFIISNILLRINNSTKKIIGYEKVNISVFGICNGGSNIMLSKNMSNLYKDY